MTPAGATRAAAENSLFTRIVTKIVDLRWPGLRALTLIPSSSLRVMANSLFHRNFP